MRAAESTAGFARTSPEGGCFEQGGGLDGAGVQSVQAPMCVFENSPDRRQVRAERFLHMRLCILAMCTPVVSSVGVICECVFVVRFSCAGVGFSWTAVCWSSSLSPRDTE